MIANSGMQILVTLITWAIFGGICASIAQSRGRSPFGWFVVGALFPCLGIILVLVLPDLAAEQGRLDKLRRDNRRLREQLKKDRTVADRRQDIVDKRLDIHDRALGLDTGDDEALPPPAPQLRAGDGEQLRRASWFYIRDTEQHGPLAFDDLKGLWRNGELDGTHYVWCEGMDDWSLLRDMPELEAAFLA